MNTHVNQWTCAKCSNTGPGTKPPRFIPDPDQPVPGTRIGVCEGCYRAARAANKTAPKIAVVGAPASALAAATSEGTENTPVVGIAQGAPTNDDPAATAPVPRSTDVVRSQAQAGTCERCGGPIAADAVRRRKPRTTCSDRCRVALWHARKKTAA